MFHLVDPNGKVGDFIRACVASDPDANFYGFINADFPIMKWECDLLSGEAGTNGIAFARNRPTGSIIGGAICFGGDLVRALGDQFVPAGIVRDCVDLAWASLIETFPGLLTEVNLDRLDPVPWVTDGHDTDVTDQAKYRGWMVSRERNEAVDRIAALLGLRVNKMDMANVKLAICYPMGDSKMEAAFYISLQTSLALMGSYGMQPLLIHTAGGSHIGKTREHLLWKAMASECTHFLFIDDDMGWDARLPMHLLASGHDFVGAVGVRKIDKLSLCCNFMPNPQGQWFHPDTNFLRIREMGFAFVLLKREVVERMCAAYPELEYTRDDGGKEHALFLDMIDDGQRLSEDLSFCRRWHKMGGEIYIDPSISLIHVGRKEYTGRVSDLYEPLRASDPVNHARQRNGALATAAE